MSDSNAPDTLDAKHDRITEHRIEAIKQWVEYIRSEPSEKWGPQQTAVVNDQLEAAQRGRTSAAHRQRVTDGADEILDASDTDGSGWE